MPVPCFVAIAIPSFRLLHLQYSYPKADITLKATGYTWYWEHSYPEHDITFETRMLDDASREELIAKNLPAPRNLAVDNEVIIPVNKVVNVLITAAPDMSLAEAAAAMRNEKIGSLPVLEQGRVVGIITETDLLRHIVRVDAGCPPECAEIIVSYP